MRVLNYEAHNVMGVKDIKFDLTGRHLFIVGGKNDQGKTSSISALLMALCGKSGYAEYPEVALREGETKGWVKVQLEGQDAALMEDKGLTVELLLVRKRSGVVAEEFRVLDSSGEEAPTPRKILQDLYNLKAFDPLAFERLSKKEKVELLRKLLGLDFSELNKKYKQLYDQRTAINKEVTKAEVTFNSCKLHADAPKAEIVTADLLADLEKRQKANEANAAERKKLVMQQEACDDNVKEVGRVEAHIKQLQADLAELMREGQVLCKERDAIKDRVDKLQDADIEAAKAAIKNADGENAKYRSNQQREAAKLELDRLVKESDQLSDQMESITEEKTQAMKEAKWPVPGLSMDEDGVLFNGLPFEQANKATRVLTSAKVGMALNPSLRLLVCGSGSDLDTDTLVELEKILKANDFQMIVEFVTRTTADEDLCAVVIQDGEIKAL